MKTKFYLGDFERGTASGFHHCNTKRSWQTYLHGRFDNGLEGTDLDYGKTISNASFRLAGLEAKIGLLLAERDAISVGEQIISGAVRPSIVIDAVLSTYSIFEGLTFLSHVEHTRADQRERVIAGARAQKIAKGLEAVLGRRVGAEERMLRALRDRCIHQDRADQQDGRDYEHVFRDDALQPHVALLFEYLAALQTEDNQMPKTNLAIF